MLQLRVAGALRARLSGFALPRASILDRCDAAIAVSTIAYVISLMTRWPLRRPKRKPLMGALRYAMLTHTGGSGSGGSGENRPAPLSLGRSRVCVCTGLLTLADGAGYPRYQLHKSSAPHESRTEVAYHPCRSACSASSRHFWRRRAYLSWRGPRQAPPRAALVGFRVEILGLGSVTFHTDESTARAGCSEQ
jgi:hypothetical protein